MHLKRTLLVVTAALAFISSNVSVLTEGFVAAKPLVIARLTDKPGPPRDLSPRVDLAQQQCAQGSFMCTVFQGGAPQNWCCRIGSRCGNVYGTCN
jgi:hypothetical protein